jgi:hypothetical protein
MRSAPLVYPDSKFNRSDNAVIRVYDDAANVIDPVGLFTGRSQSNMRRISGLSHLFAFSHHPDKSLFDGDGSFRRAQTKRECFM